MDKTLDVGYTISDGTHGTIFIGKDDKVDRPRQIEIHATSNAAIKLFEDGGFEIQSQPSSKLADNIISQSEHGLMVRGENIHFSAAKEITLSARAIRFESTGSDETFVIRSNSNIIIDSNDTIKLDGSVIGIGARTKMILNSKGPIFMRGIGGVTIVEPKQKLIPTNLSDVLNIMMSTLFPDF